MIYDAFLRDSVHLRNNDRSSTNGVPGRASYPIIRRLFIGRWRFIEREKFTARRAFSRYIGARGLKARVVKQSRGGDGRQKERRIITPTAKPKTAAAMVGNCSVVGKERRRVFNSFHEWTKAGPGIGPKK